MPFKTKKQKLAASERRFAFVDGKVSFVGIKTNEAKNKLDSMGYSNKELTIKEDASLARELLKIIVICTVIIGIQVGLRLTLF